MITIWCDTCWAIDNILQYNITHNLHHHNYDYGFHSWKCFTKRKEKTFGNMCSASGIGRCEWKWRTHVYMEGKFCRLAVPAFFFVLMWKCMKNLIECRILYAYLTAVTVLYPNYLSVYMAGEQDWFRCVITYWCRIIGRCCNLTLCMKGTSCTVSYIDVNKIQCSGKCLCKDS